MENTKQNCSQSKKFLRGLLSNILASAFYFSLAHPAAASNDLGLLKDGTSHFTFQTFAQNTFAEEFFFEVASIQTVIDGHLTAKFGYVTLSDVSLASIVPYPELDLWLLENYRFQPSQQPIAVNSIAIGNLSKSPDSENFTGRFRLSVSGTQLPIAQEIKLSLYVSSVPEPTTSLMFGAGLLLIAGARFISKTNHA